METRPPTVTRILVAVGFALSCFGLALFLWIAFGGPLPLKPEGYRFTVPFKEATQLAVESDVRISGVSVGKVKSIEPRRQRRSPTRRSRSTARTRRFPSNTRAMLRQKTLLGETYVELTPGIESGAALPEGGSLPTAQVSERGPARRDLPDLRRADAPGLQGLDAGAAAALKGRGADLSAALAELEPFAEPTNRVLRILDTQQQAVKRAGPQRRRRFHALSERQGQLRGLIQNSDAVFSTTAPRNAGPRADLPDPADVPRESRLTLDAARTASPPTPTRWSASCSPRRKAAQPDVDRRRARPRPDLERFFDGLRGRSRPRHRLPGAPQAAQRRPHAAALTARDHVGGRSPCLAEFNPILKVLAEVQARGHGIPREHRCCHELRPARAEAERQARQGAPNDEPAEPAEPGRVPAPADHASEPIPYFKPLGYNNLKQGLESFANTPCSARDHGDAAARVPGRHRPQLPRPLQTRHRDSPGIRRPRRPSFTAGSSSTRWATRRTPTRRPLRRASSREASSRSGSSPSSASICTCAPSHSAARKWWAQPAIRW